MFCPQCGSNLPDGAQFCPSCGTRAPTMSGMPQFQPASAPPQPPPPPPSICPSCRATITPGRAFCTSCGFALGGQSAPPPAAEAWSGNYGQVRTAPASAGDLNQLLGMLSPFQFALLGGFIVAAISTLLPWLKFSGEGISVSVSGWKTKLFDSPIHFQIADWLGLEGKPVDALIVLVAAVLGLVLLVGPLLGKSVPSIPFGPVLMAAIVLAVGLSEAYLILSEDEGKLSNFGIGLWALLASGVVGVVFGYLDMAQRLQRR